MNTIHWIDAEIRARVNDSRLAIEGFARDPDQPESLTSCVDLIHQIGGALKILNAHGTMLLVDEMERLAAALASAEVVADEDALGALMRAMTDLLHQLDVLRAGAKVDPNATLQAVNDLRSARNESLLDESVLFRPALWVALELDSRRRKRIAGDAGKGLRRIRAYYQQAMLKLLRGDQTGLARLDAVAEKMEELSAGRARGRLWWCSRGVLEALQCDGLELTAAVRKLMVQLDMDLRELVRVGPPLLDRRPPADLLRHLLYYVSRARSTGRRCGEIRAAFDLATPDSQTRSDTLGTSRKSAALSAVAAPLMEQIEDLKKWFYDMQGRVHEPGLRDEASRRVLQLSDTMGLLGLDPLRASLRAHAQRVTAATAAADGEESLVAMAQALIDAEAVVLTLASSGEVGTGSAESIAELRHQHLVQSVVGELNVELFALKEGLSAYALDTTATELLGSFMRHGSLGAGAARMLGSKRMATLLGGWTRFIQDTVIDAGRPLPLARLEEFAAVIVQIDAALARMSGQGGDDRTLAELVGSMPRGRPEQIRPATAAGPGRDAPVAAAAQAAMTAPAEVGPFSPAYMESPDGRSDAAEPTACAIPEFVDDELMAIFGDEMQEVIETLDSMVPDWPEHSDDDERLREIRRCFHTLKGSGRVVGANQIGELAWCVERVLNRVIDGSLDMSLEIIEQVREIGGALPSLRAGYLAREPMIEVGRFIERMDELGA